jgi:signal peptidase I
METLGRLPRIASVVAFVIAGIVILNGLLGPVVVLPFAIVPLCSGIGILRRRVWGAYGFATFFFTQLLLVPVILLRPGSSAGRATQIVEIVFWFLLGILFLSAGRSLAASGAARGWPFPWIAVSALTVVPFFFVQTFEIASQSMEETLLPGDRILAQEFPRPTPKRGEMVLFLSPTERGLVLIKRIIAGPGDRIRIAKKVVILNGTAIDEKYVTHDADEHYGENFPNDEIDVNIPGCAEGHEMVSRQVVNGEVVVPAGRYFVLGDRREDSLDSRCWGFISSSDVIGKPLVIYDSIERTSEQELDPNKGWLGRRRWSRLFKVF